MTSHPEVGGRAPEWG